MRDAFVEELTQLRPSTVASRWILERVPHVFGNDQTKYITWRAILADKIGVDPCAIAFTGSSSVGISLNPVKNFKAFDDRSDIDLAVISQYHFDVSWRYIRNIGSGWHGLTPSAKNSIIEHRSKYIFYGTIATDKILAYLPFGKEWLIALNEMAAVDPTEGREIKARVYRDFDSLRGYQVSNLEKLSYDVINIRTRQRGR